MNLLRVREREAGKNKTLGPELQSCGRWLADLTLPDLALAGCAVCGRARGRGATVTIGVVTP